MKLVFIDNQRPVTDSLTIAESFGKEHKNVLRDIRNLECSEEFSRLNFEHTPYIATNGQSYEKYLITQDGFSFLVMGYTGKEAARFKEMYINEFNRMKSELTMNQLQTQFNLPRNMIEATEFFLLEMKKNAQLESEKQILTIENTEQKQKLKEQEAPVAIYNLAISANNTLSMAEVAKSFNTGRTRLYRILREEKLVMPNSTLPYQRFIDAGYFKVVERPRASGDTIQNDPATRITAKGFDYIAKIMHRRNTNLALVQ